MISTFNGLTMKGVRIYMRLLYVIILFFMSFLFVSCSNYDLKDRGKSYIEKGNIVISSDNASEHGVSVK